MLTYLGCRIAVVTQVIAALVFAVQGEPVELVNEHVDIKIVYQPEADHPLAIMISDDDHGRVYSPEEVVLVVADSAQWSLPAGTPFGDEGAPMWILPQSQDPNLLYLGFSAEGVPSSVFPTPFAFTLKHKQGPGEVFVWQVGGVGGLDVRINSCDGLTASDFVTPVAGGHEHFNYGFTSNGVYRLTFVVTGQRQGDTNLLASAETTLTFKVLPLPETTPFQDWQARQWPEGGLELIIGPEADPDGDGLSNLLEYALNTNPQEPVREGLPVFSFVSDSSQTYGALTYIRVKSATDITYEVLATSCLVPPQWEVCTNVIASVDTGATESVTVRDFSPRTNTSKRFYQLRVTLRP